MFAFQMWKNVGENNLLGTAIALPKISLPKRLQKSKK